MRNLFILLAITAISGLHALGCEDDVPQETDGDADGDSDGDGDGDAEIVYEGVSVLDWEDNCRQLDSSLNTDHDDDGIIDECEEQDGSASAPFIIPVTEHGAEYQDSQDTSLSANDDIDVYPPDENDESGPEYFYVFTLPSRMSVSAWIDAPEPEGVDVDVHLLSSLDPLGLLARGHYRVDDVLDAGTYYLSLDSWGGDEQAGPYTLTVLIQSWHAGTVEDPVVFVEGDVSDPVELPLVWFETRTTEDAESDVFDNYPPNETDQSGPEVIYGFTIDEPVYFAAELLLPEPYGTDIDLHLLSSLSPVELINRDNYKILAELEPGTYFVVADTYSGDYNSGEYTINITLRSQHLAPETLFADYIVAATEWLFENYGLLGYNAGSVLTHDIQYGPYDVIPQTGVEGKTMCVAAVMEIILTAMQLYEDDTGDADVWHFLPWRSWRYLGPYDIRGHLWVNYGDIDSGGSADALRHFGMGMNVPFEQLVPGSMINMNRSNGTGHAVVFLAFIDIDGVEYETYPDDVEIVGFTYFSSQGRSAVGSGGLDYRWAVFSDHGCPAMPGQRDCEIFYSEDQHWLNSGVIYHPTQWRRAYYTMLNGMKSSDAGDVTLFDSEYFNGLTTDDY